ncbi:MAG: adenylate/guanylate cyclase domain-containing protein [Chloroflexota bacterium]|nr:adenylate/guanylate cyclase domain-containing protein [Chloroflexota bacterium]
MTDIVDSTARAVALGPARWRELVSQHNEVAERIIDEHDGRLVKTTGDGTIGTFDSAERAIRAGAVLVDRVAALDLRIRAGVHTGELELVQGDVRGLAVHTAARILDLAQPGEVVVSSTVRELVDGTALEFEDHGIHALRGLPGQRRLYHLLRPRAARLRPPAGAH